MSNLIFHYGVLGQRWGVRRYQNKDGSLTPRGLRRYVKNDSQSSPEKKSVSSGSNATGSTTKGSPYRHNPKERHLKNVASTKSNIKKMYDDSIPGKTAKTEYAKDKVNSLVGKIGSKSASDTDSWTSPKDFNPPTFKQWEQNRKNAASQTKKSEEKKTKKQETTPDDKKETKNKKQGDQQQETNKKTKKKVDADSLARDANTIKRITDENNPREKKKMDLSKLSNKEMQEALQRKNLERQYLKEFGEDTSLTKAMNQVSNVLGIAGDTLTVVSSIESITNQFSNKRK